MADPASIQNTAVSFATNSMASMDTIAQQAINAATEGLEWAAYWDAPQWIAGYNGGYIAQPASVVMPSVNASIPVAPTLGAVTVPVFGNAPEFLMAEPILNLPVSPSTTLPGSPGSAPEFIAPPLPDVPTYLLPDAPTFQNVIVPDAPALDMPVFTSELPIDDIIAPSEVFSYIEPVYESALLDELKSKLMYDLVNGGYGIDDADEMRLWERAREREQLSLEANIQEVTRQAAARGFAMPPGALQALISQAGTAALEKNSSLSREIMSKKADLYVQNRQFTMQQTREVEQMLITAFGYMAERLLNVAKATVELSIASFNARVAKYNLMLDTYKASAQVYAELIRGATLKLEAYKAEVEGAKLTADVQRIHAEVYKVQVDGVQALINVYATQVQAAKTIAEIERIKLEGFKAAVDTYIAQVQAKTAEFGMFESQIKGEMAKVNVYAASAQAYGTQVAAYKTKADAAEITVRSQVQANQLKLEIYRSDIQRYSADIQRSQYQLASAVSVYDADIKKYSVTLDGVIRSSQQNIEAGKANAEIAVSHANVLSNFAMHSAQILQAKAAASASTLGSMASSYGSAAGSAMSAATGLVANIA